MAFLRDASSLSLSTFLVTVLTALRSVVLIRIVEPATFGVWKAVLVLPVMAEYARLGVTAGLVVRVPALNGSGDDEEAVRHADAAGAFAVLVGVVLLTAALVASVFVEDSQYRLALQFVAMLLLLFQVRGYLLDLASARHQFMIRLKDGVLWAVVNFAAAVTLAWMYGLAGLAAGTVIGVLVSTAYLMVKLRFRLKHRLDTARLKSLIRIGMPCHIMDYAFDVVRYLSVALVALMLGAEAAGHWALGILILEFCNGIAVTGLTKVATPHLLREFGRDNRIANYSGYYEGPARLFCYVLPPLLGVAVIVVPVLVTMFVPRYAPGIGAAQIVLWGAFFIAIQASLSAFIVAAGKVFTMIRALSVIVPLGVLAQYIAVQNGAGLAGAAWSVLLAYAAITTAGLIIARRQSGESPAQALRFVISLYAPLVAACAMSLYLYPVQIAGGLTDLAAVAIKALVYLALNVPLLALYESRFHLLRKACRALTETGVSEALPAEERRGGKAEASSVAGGV